MLGRGKFMAHIRAMTMDDVVPFTFGRYLATMTL